MSYIPEVEISTRVEVSISWTVLVTSVVTVETTVSNKVAVSIGVDSSEVGVSMLIEGKADQGLLEETSDVDEL